MRGGGLAMSLRQLSPEKNAILTLDAPGDPCFSDVKAPVFALGPAKGKFGIAPGVMGWIEAHLHEFDAAVIHGLWQYHGAAFLLAKKPSKFPYFVMPHGMLDPWFWKAYPLKGLKKLLYWAAIERWLFKGARGVFFTADGELRKAQWLSAVCPGLQKVVPFGIVPPTVDPEAAKAQFFTSHPAFRECKTILFLSRIHPKKGVHWLVEAWKQLEADGAIPQEWVLLVAGPHAESEAAYFEVLKENAMGSRVVFLDHLGGLEKWGAFSVAEAFILPSQQENFGFAVVEALYMGTPVLISQAIDIADRIAAEGAGFVAPASLEGTREVLRHFFALSPSEHTILKKNVLKCFHEFFDISDCKRGFFDASAEI
jgi:glycosyltransferase involved in cell wall biosynthesis